MTTKRSIAGAVLAASAALGPVLAGTMPTAAAGTQPAAAAVGQDPGRGRPEAAPPPGTERDVRVVPLGANGFLELKTPSGDISVVAGPGRDVRIEVIKRPRGRTPEEVRRSLEAATVAIDHQGERATVVALVPGDRRASNTRAQVSFLVTAPAGTRISAHATSGNVTVRDIKGEIAAEVTSGQIEISNAGSVSLARTVSGNITLHNISGKGDLTVGSVSGVVVADRVTAEHVDIDVASGTITARDVTATRATMRSLSGTVDFSGRLIKGGRYEFVSHSGDVRVATSGAGYVLQANSFSGSIHADSALGLKAVSASPRAFRGTIGDGSATVVATTFSGNITLGRR